MKNPGQVIGDIRNIHKLYLEKTPVNYRQVAEIPIKDLISDIEDYYSNEKLSIELKSFTVSTINRRILGYYKCIDNNVTIIHADGGVDNIPNYCMRRYIVAKELSHYIVDNTESFTVNAGDLMKELAIQNNSFIPDPDSPLAQQKRAEEMAKIYGILLLFPFEQMKIKKRQLSIPNNGVNERSIAEEFKIPVTLIEYILSDPLFDWVVNNTSS